MKQYMTSQELARHLRRSVWSIYDLVREGRIPTVRLRPGGNLLFDPEAVEAALQVQAARPAEVLAG